MARKCIWPPWRNRSICSYLRILLLQPPQRQRGGCLHSTRPAMQVSLVFLTFLLHTAEGKLNKLKDAAGSEHCLHPIRRHRKPPPNTPSPPSATSCCSSSHLLPQLPGADYRSRPRHRQTAETRSLPPLYTPDQGLPSRSTLAF